MPAEEGNESVKELTEIDLGYQKRIKIHYPKGLKPGHDPYDKKYKDDLLPINDSFGQIPFPCEDTEVRHIMLNFSGPPDAGAKKDEPKKDGEPKVEVAPAPTPAPPQAPEAASTPAPEEEGKKKKPPKEKSVMLEYVEPTHDSSEDEIAKTQALGDMAAMAADEYKKKDAQTEIKPLEEEIQIKAVSDHGVSVQEFYHGLLPKEDIIKMLKKPGDFLVRSELGEKNERLVCISANNLASYVVHVMIQQKAGKVFVEEGKVFATSLELVNWYMMNKKTFGNPKVELRNPICRQDWEYTLDKVQCIKPIGAGAFGQVFMGKITANGASMGIEAAIKQMKLQLMDKNKIEEIMREARLMRMIRHRNIVHCYGISADQEPLMILMEFVHGGSLDIYLKANTVKISIGDREQMCSDAATGLSEIHSRGIIHRDIAARNCLYSSHKVLKISDFGLSRQARMYRLDPKEKMPVRTLAPEVFRTHHYTSQADVWAYGVLLWEIFTNCSEPYQGWKGLRIKDEILNKNYRLGVPLWAPPFIKEMLSQCFHGDPAVRTKMHVLVKVFANVKKAKIDAEKAAKAKKAADKKAENAPTPSDRKPDKPKEKKSAAPAAPAIGTLPGNESSAPGQSISTGTVPGVSQGLVQTQTPGKPIVGGPAAALAPGPIQQLPGSSPAPGGAQGNQTMVAPVTSKTPLDQSGRGKKMKKPQKPGRTVEERTVEDQTLDCSTRTTMNGSRRDKKAKKDNINNSQRNKKTKKKKANPLGAVSSLINEGSTRSKRAKKQKTKKGTQRR